MDFLKTFGSWARHLRTNRVVSSFSSVNSLLALALWAIVLYYGLTYSIPRRRYGALFLGLAIVIYVTDAMGDLFDRPDIRWSRAIPLVLVLGICVVTTAYVWENFEGLRRAYGSYSTFEYAIGALFLGAILYVTAHEFGKLFTILITGVLAYGVFGYLFPSWLYHAGIEPTRIIRITVLSMRGVYGSLNETAAVMIAPFLLFAGLVYGFGIFDLGYRIAIKLSEHTKSGVAQSAVVLSMIMGMVSGSSMANSAMTGSFTIPLMKESGIRDYRAGAIEASASTGGQILPPVMGSAAFLMVDLAGKSLVSILFAALLPALTFYVAIFLSVEIIARQDLTDSAEVTPVADGPPAKIETESPAGLDAEDLDMIETGDRTPTTFLVVKSLILILPIAFLVYMLGVVRETVMVSAIYTCFVTLGLGVLYHNLYYSYRDYSKSRRPRLVQNNVKIVSMIVEGAKFGANNLAPIAVIIAAVGAAVEILLTTGLPTMLTFILTDLSGGSLILFLLISMVVVIMLGMGMPTPAAYVVAAILVVPTLVEFGQPELPSHFFVLYFAVLSVITPPIAVTTVVTSSIAQANFWWTCYESLKISLPIFLLPFAFLLNPSLIQDPFSVPGMQNLLTVVLGTIVLVIGLFIRRFPYDVDPPDVVLHATKLALVVGGALVLVRPF